MPRTVLITGASSGIGLESAIWIARRGFRVVGTVRSEEKARAVQRIAAQARARVETVLLDVTDATEGARVIDDLEPYGLVNNAGYPAAGALEDVDDDEARLALETMVVAPMRLARLALRHMRAGRRPHRERVVDLRLRRDPVRRLVPGGQARARRRDRRPPRGGRRGRRPRGPRPARRRPDPPLGGPGASGGAAAWLVLRRRVRALRGVAAPGAAVHPPARRPRRGGRARDDRVPAPGPLPGRLRCPAAPAGGALRPDGGPGPGHAARARPVARQAASRSSAPT